MLFSILALLTSLLDEFTLPNTIASAGQACWQAVFRSHCPSSPVFTGRLLFLASNLPSWQRWIQKVHFSITPLERTVTSGFNTILVSWSFIISTTSFTWPTWLSGKLSEPV